MRAFGSALVLAMIVTACTSSTVDGTTDPPQHACASTFAGHWILTDEKTPETATGDCTSMQDEIIRSGKAVDMTIDRTTLDAQSGGSESLVTYVNSNCGGLVIQSLTPRGTGMTLSQERILVLAADHRLAGTMTLHLYRTVDLGKKDTKPVCALNYRTAITKGD